MDTPETLFTFLACVSIWWMVSSGIISPGLTAVALMTVAIFTLAKERPKE